MNEQRILTGQIIAESVTIGNPKWGNIQGDISNQIDLINLLKEKKDSDAKQIAVFFSEKPEYAYRFLISMANRPVIDVKDYFQLIIDDYGAIGKGLWVPYDASNLCLILKVNERDPGNIIRFYVPSTGEIGFIDLADESGLVKYTYKVLGDDLDEAAQWGNILGDIQNQTDLMEALGLKVNYSDEADPDDIHHIFE